MSIALICAMSLAFGMGTHAYAQSAPREILNSLSRLQNNPNYAGRVLSTQLRNSSRGPLYEVRILRSDDRVVIVYIDPRTGGVVGDTLRSGQKGKKNRNKGRKKKN